MDDGIELEEDQEHQAGCDPAQGDDALADEDQGDHQRTDEESYSKGSGALLEQLPAGVGEESDNERQHQDLDDGAEHTSVLGKSG